MIRSRGFAIVVGFVVAMVVASAAFASRRTQVESPAHAAPASTTVSPGAPPTWGTKYPPGFGEMAFAPDGTLYVTDCGDARMYRVTPGHPGVTKVVGGKGPGGFPVWTKLTKVGWLAHHEIRGDGLACDGRLFSCPGGIDFDAAGNLYLADLNNDRIREISTNEVVSTYAGIGPGFNDFGPWTAGIGKRAGDGGPASHAILDAPWGIAFDANGNLFIADRDHEAIRKVDTNGVMTTVAGTGRNGYNGDHRRATEAELYRPIDIALDAADNLYISDENNRRIRKVDQYGMITTIAGDGRYACGGDGGPATRASFRNPGTSSCLTAHCW